MTHNELRSRLASALAHLYAARGELQALDSLRDTWSDVFVTKAGERIETLRASLRELDDALEKLERTASRIRRGA